VVESVHPSCAKLRYDFPPRSDVARSGGPAPGWIPLALRLRYLLGLVLLTAIYTVVAAFRLSPEAAVASGFSTWIELPLGLLVLLIAPGYGIVTLGAGKRPPWPWYLTLILIVGLSVAFNIAIGLILLSLNYGLPAVVLGLATLLVDAAAAVRAWATPPMAPDTRFESMVRREFRLPGFNPAQRAVAYTFLAAILIVLAGIAYLAIIQPRNTQDLAFSISGTGGNVTTLPTSGHTGNVLNVSVSIRNGAVAQTWKLELHAVNLTLPGTSFLQVPWGGVLLLGNGGTESSIGIPFNAGQTKTELVGFEFSAPGHYNMNFTLNDLSGSPVRNASFSVSITNPPSVAGTLAPSFWSESSSMKWAGSEVHGTSPDARVGGRFGSPGSTLLAARCVDPLDHRSRSVP
jgi:uncharacterized membrane protein